MMIITLPLGPLTLTLPQDQAEALLDQLQRALGRTPAPAGEEFLAPAAFGARVGIPKWQVYEYLHDPSFPCLRTERRGSRVRIPLQAAQAWLVDRARRGRSA